MNITEKLKAWLKPKDLSLVLEIEGTLVEDNSGILSALNGKYYNMLEPQYGGRTVVLVFDNETDDRKTRFYVTPSIRGRRDNITWEEFKALYPKTPHLCYFLERKGDRDTIKVFAASTS